MPARPFQLGKGKGERKIKVIVMIMMLEISTLQMLLAFECSPTVCFKAGELLAFARLSHLLQTLL